jgi:hypothetical protein
MGQDYLDILQVGSNILLGEHTAEENSRGACRERTPKSPPFRRQCAVAVVRHPLPVRNLTILRAQEV